MSPAFRKSSRPPVTRRRLPHFALLLMGLLLSGVVLYYTWPPRAAIFCENMPELGALGACAAVLMVVSFRALSTAPAANEDRRISGSALILAALALFLSVRFIAQYHKPCQAVQQMQHGSGQAK